MRISVDRSRPLAEEPGSGHNRWHPDIEPIASVAAGVEVTLETRDGIDGQLGPGSTHADLATLQGGRAHPLTGPIRVEGAEPGDVLEVEFVGFESGSSGATAIVPGLAFLADDFPDGYVLGWEIDGRHARSPELPAVAVPADMFAGVAGIAPSLERLERTLERERRIAARGAPALPADEELSVPSSASGGLRTLPPREQGGNLDVRRLTAGSRLLLTVEVPGALFSVGDLHFAQGDGEVSGSAIEVAGAVTVRFRVRKNPSWRPRFPAYETPARRQARSFATTGIPVEVGMDVGEAAREALREMIGWLVAEHGCSREAAYCLCSAAVDLHISECVDAPYPLVSALLPLDVFESGS